MNAKKIFIKHSILQWIYANSPTETVFLFNKFNRCKSPRVVRKMLSRMFAASKYGPFLEAKRSKYLFYFADLSAGPRIEAICDPIDV